MSDQRLRLQQYLDSVPFGAITDTDTLIPLLKNAWPEFDGSDRCGMKNDKLTRIENVRWDPPYLEFTIERHGGTLLGSSRGELQHWMIDIIKGIARTSTSGYRQLHRPQHPLDVKPLMERVVTAINGRDDSCLVRRPKGSVQVRVGMLIPESSAAKQTVTDRRRRFRSELNERLATVGWYPVTGHHPYTYERQ